MSCESIKELILDYTADELDDVDRLRVENHIKDCIDCNQFLLYARNEWRLLEEWGNIDPSGDIINRFWKRVSDENLGKENGIFSFFKSLIPSWSLIPSLSFVFAMVVASILFIYLSNQPVSYTERDKKDEELLFELDRTLSINNISLLEIYGPWDDKLIKN